MPKCFSTVALPVTTALVVLGSVLPIGCGPSSDPTGGTPNGTSNPAATSTDSDSSAADSSLNLDDVFNDVLSEDMPAVAPSMTEVAREIGLDFEYFNDARENRYYFPEILGGGIACLDYDLDGWTDIYFANGRTLPIEDDDEKHGDQLFRCAPGGQFQNITEFARLRELRYSHGCTFGDINADGFDDIAVAGYGAISLFLNQGDGTYLPVADDQLNVFPTWSTCPLIADLNQDQIPDLFVVNYVGWTYDIPACLYESIRGYCGPGQFNPLRNYAFINQGNGDFVEQGESMGFTERGKGLAIAAVDFDHDLKSEFYIANDLVKNFLYVSSEQPGTYVESGDQRGVAVAGSGMDEASMSVTPADFDRNGFADLFVTNYYKKKNTLYLNRGKNFLDASMAARTHATGEMYLGFGALAFDFDKDGWTDVFVGNGHVLGPEHIPNQMTNQILRNEDGVFQDVSAGAGPFFQIKTLSRGSSQLDLDRDLDTDLIVNHIDRRISVLRNDTQTDNHAIAVSVFSPQHRPLEGSRIEVEFADSKQTIPVTAGGSYLSDPERKWIIGVGDLESVNVTVYWNDGAVDRWPGLATDREWRFAPSRKWSNEPFEGSQKE